MPDLETGSVSGGRVEGIVGASAMQQRSVQLTNTDIDTAFEQGQFGLRFQPKLALSDDRVAGLEAFVRWHHPELGVIPPGLFLSYVERQGRMIELTKHVLRLAAKTAGLWRAEGRDWSLSVNVSAVDLIDGALPQTLSIIMREYDLPADRLTIEVPELDFARRWDRVVPGVRDLRSLGVGVSLEGTGIAAIPLEAMEPFTEMKIGGSSILKLAHTLKAADYGAIPARLRLADQLSLHTVASGVEDEETLATVRDLGFDQAQGNVICRPLPAKDIEQWDAAFRREQSLTRPAEAKPVQDQLEALEQAFGAEGPENTAQTDDCLDIPDPAGARAPETEPPVSQVASLRKLAGLDRPAPPKEARGFWRGILGR